MNKILKSKVIVRFQDCDPFNHLNNSAYIDYFFNARQDHLIENYHFDLFREAFEKGTSWIVTANQLAYFKPALTLETVLIESQLIHFTPKSLKLEMRMWNESQTELKAFLWTDLLHVDLKLLKTTAHSEEHNTFFEQIVLPVNAATFEERTKSLRFQRKALVTGPVI